MKLAQLEFSDLYLEPDGTAWAKQSTDNRGRTVLDCELLDDSQLLRERLQEHKTGIDFSTAWDGIRLRVQRIETVDGDVFVCRKLHSNILGISQIGYPQKLVDALMNEQAFSKGGVVLFTGSTGAGKSTSLASWVASRLKAYGGTCWTVENPIEMGLAGRYVGDGVVGTCYQTEVREEQEIKESIQRFLRAAPTMIMVGEIRTEGAAAQTVFAGTSGTLACATFHANDILSALQRMKGLLSPTDMSAFADSLGAVIHQSITTRVVAGVEKRVFNVSPFIVNGSRNSTSIRSHLRSGDFSMLVSEIERQRNILFSDLKQQVL